MPVVARLAKGARTPARRIVPGETVLPRRLHQHPALALAALAAAFVHLSMVTEARAQGAGTSPFQPSLTDPRNVQRFGTSDPTTRAMAGSTPLATAKDIVPPSGAGETGFDSTGAISKKKKAKAKKKPGEPRPLPAPPPPQLPLPSAPQAAAGHTSAPQIKARAPYADAYKPPDAPPRRP